MLILLLGCKAPADAPPDLGEGPQSGYFAVTVTSARASDVLAVDVGGIAAYGLHADGSTLTFTVQGSPVAGPAAVAFTTASGTIDAGTFRYTEGSVERLVAIGASLTQGVQSGVPTFHGGLASPSFQVARQLGAYHPLPLLVDGLFPPIEVSDLGPPPACDPPGIASHIADAAASVVAKLVDPATGDLSYARGRVDPTLTPYNVGVGGLTLSQLLDGPGDDAGLDFIADFVLDPTASVFSMPDVTPIEAVEALDPTMILVLEPFGNDVLVPALDMDPSALPDPDVFAADADRLLARLSATGADVFVATLPRVSMLPAARDANLALAAQLVGDGLSADDAAAEADAVTAEIDTQETAFNSTWAALAAVYPNVHVADLAAAADVWANGVEIGGASRGIDAFGGLISLDGVHFSDTGYALVANTFLDAIDPVLGTTTKRIDLDAVLASDPFSPGALAAEGLDPACSKL